MTADTIKLMEGKLAKAEARAHRWSCQDHAQSIQALIEVVRTLLSEESKGHANGKGKRG